MKLLIGIFALVGAVMSDSNDLERVLKAGNDQFTANVFREVAKERNGKSFVLSAFSVLSPLAQLSLAAVGETHDELLRAIGLPNDNVTKEVFSDINKKLRSVEGVELKQANKVYVRQGYSLNKNFAALSRDIFNSEVQNIDFSKAKQAANEMNKWVEDQTNNRIKDLVDPQSITSDTRAVLLNAIYFKGQWKDPFDQKATSDRIFHISKDKSVTIPMMYKNSNFKYAESAELDAKLLELPYEGGQSSLVIALPNQIEGINGLIEKLKDPAAFNNAFNQLSDERVEVTLPKFKIETQTNLKKVLQKINVKDLFDQSAAQLPNLLTEEKLLYISAATQKAFIEVNEEGVTAAAANEFGIVYLSALITNLEFKADHPFVFFLMEKNNILFNGVFRS